MLRDIMSGHYEFVSPEWDDISEGPKNLVSRRKRMKIGVQCHSTYSVDP